MTISYSDARAQLLLVVSVTDALYLNVSCYLALLACSEEFGTRNEGIVAEKVNGTDRICAKRCFEKKKKKWNAGGVCVFSNLFPTQIVFYSSVAVLGGRVASDVNELAAHSALVRLNSCLYRTAQTELAPRVMFALTCQAGCSVSRTNARSRLKPVCRSSRWCVYDKKKKKKTC